MELLSINGWVFGALAFLTISLCACLCMVLALIPQVQRTLAAYIKLADTLEEELVPTLFLMGLKAPSWWNDEGFLKSITALLFVCGSIVFLSSIYQELPPGVRWLLLPIYLIKSLSLAREYFI